MFKLFAILSFALVAAVANLPPAVEGTNSILALVIKHCYLNLANWITLTLFDCYVIYLGVSKSAKISKWIWKKLSNNLFRCFFFQERGDDDDGGSCNGVNVAGSCCVNSTCCGSAVDASQATFLNCNAVPVAAYIAANLLYCPAGCAGQSSCFLSIPLGFLAGVVPQAVCAFSAQGACSNMVKGPADSLGCCSASSNQQCTKP